LSRRPTDPARNPTASPPDQSRPLAQQVQPHSFPKPQVAEVTFNQGRKEGQETPRKNLVPYFEGHSRGILLPQLEIPLSQLALDTRSSVNVDDPTNAWGYMLQVPGELARVFPFPTSPLSKACVTCWAFAVQNYRKLYGTLYCEACVYRREKETFQLRRDAENLAEVLILSQLDVREADIRRRAYTDSQGVGVNRASTSAATPLTDTSVAVQFSDGDADDFLDSSK
jgi:hypothetical protein